MSRLSTNASGRKCIPCSFRLPGQVSLPIESHGLGNADVPQLQDELTRHPFAISRIFFSTKIYDQWRVEGATAAGSSLLLLPPPSSPPPPLPVLPLQLLPLLLLRALAAGQLPATSRGRLCGPELGLGLRGLTSTGATAEELGANQREQELRAFAMREHN